MISSSVTPSVPVSSRSDSAPLSVEVVSTTPSFNCFYQLVGKRTAIRFSGSVHASVGPLSAAAGVAVAGAGAVVAVAADALVAVGAAAVAGAVVAVAGGVGMVMPFPPQAARSRQKS